MQCSISELREAARQFKSTKLEEMFALFVNNLMTEATENVFNPSSDVATLIRFQMQGHAGRQFLQLFEIINAIPEMGKSDLIDLATKAGITVTDEESSDA